MALQQQQQQQHLQGVQTPLGAGASPMNTSIDSKSTADGNTGTVSTSSVNSSSMANGTTATTTSTSTSGATGTTGSSSNGATAGNPVPRQQASGQSDDDSGCALEEYTWVPPGLKPDQVGKASKLIS